MGGLKFSTNSAAPPPRSPRPHDPRIRWMPKDRPQSIQSQKIQLSILMQADLKMQYSSPAMATGKTAFLKILNGLGSRHWRHLISASIIQIKSDAPRGFESLVKRTTPLFQLSNIVSAFEKEFRQPS
ncbi:MAG: hypothetical protein ACLUFL_01740 [Flavonifractor plautii]